MFLDKSGITKSEDNMYYERSCCNKQVKCTNIAHWKTQNMTLGFNCIQKLIEEKGICMNICAIDKHVREIEWYKRMVKEKAWAIAMNLPFKRYLPRTIIKMVYNTVFGWTVSKTKRVYAPQWGAHNNGVHTTTSPRIIMMGQRLNYNKYWKIEFRAYIHRPSRSKQGRYYFLSLHTGKMDKKQLDRIMYAHIIDIIQQLVSASK